MEHNNFDAYEKATTEMPYEELSLRNYFIFGKVMEDRKLCIQMLENKATAIPLALDGGLR